MLPTFRMAGGLLYCEPKRVITVVEAKHQDEKNWQREQAILLSCFRRLGKPRPEACVSVRYYTYATKNRTTLGVCEDE